jgi:hypothetical protein
MTFFNVIQHPVIPPRRHDQSMGFSQVLDDALPINVAALKNKAYAANRFAKTTDGHSASRAYEAKGRAISQLLIVGAASVNSVTVLPDALLGLTFVEGGSLHIRFSQLSPEAQGAVFQQLGQLGGRHSATGCR